MGKLRQVAIVVDSSRPFHRKILLGVAAYVHEVGNWSLYVEDEPIEKLPDLNSWCGDGMLVTFVDRRVVRAVTNLGIPLVGLEGGMGWYDPASQIPYFTTDNAAIGRLGAEHLIEQGFLHLAYCGVPPARMHMWSGIRAEAFRARAVEGGVSCSIFASRPCATRKWAKLQRELAVWLESLEKPVGVMAANDARARHILEACRAVSLRVPEDVAVLGVDNDEVMCELANPPLSSIEQGARRIGYQAAATLNRLMAGKKVRTCGNLVGPNSVVMRRSTNILAIADADVAVALQHIRNHACDPMLVSDVVAATGLSRATIEPRFRAAIGRTIHSEIQRVQVERARQLIVTTDIPLKQIATLAGFPHVSHMTNVYRKHTGWTPAEYRKHSRL